MEQFSFGKTLLEILKKDQLFFNRKDTFLNSLNKSFSLFSDHSSKVYDELNVLVNDNPQLIIDLTKNFLTNCESVTKLFQAGYNAKGKEFKSQINYACKLLTISDLHELSSLFSLLVFLLGSRKLPPNQLSSSQSIIKHLKSVGLSNLDREEIRIIRNAVSHKYTIDSKHLYFKGSKIELLRIDDLYAKLDNLMNWNISLFMFALFLIPKFGGLVCMSIYLHMLKYNEEWESFFKGTELLFKDMLEDIRKEKQERKDRSRKVKQEKFGKSSEINKTVTLGEEKKFILENFEIIFERLNYHLISLVTVLNELHSKVQSGEEKALLLKTEFWIRENGDIFQEMSKSFKEDPERFKKIMENRLAHYPKAEKSET